MNLHLPTGNKDWLLKDLIAKSGRILSILNETNFHWEETFWWLIAANFGLKVNSDFFQRIAKTLPVAILAKHKNRTLQIEALLFGQAGLLNSQFHEKYPLMLQKEYQVLSKKIQIKTSGWRTVFFKNASC